MEISNVLVLSKIFLFTVLCPTTGSDPVTEQQLAEFEDFVHHVVECRGVTGMTVTLVKGNELLWSRGFGYANRDKGIPATNLTKFSVGSLTKAFTTALLVKILHDQPRFTLDTPIKEILGNDFRLIDKFRTDNVNLRDLVAHKVGVPGYFNLLYVGFPENVSRADFVRMLNCQPAVYPLRTKFLYSNYMFSLAGYVVEVITGRSWEDLVNDVILKPLGMDQSGFIDKVSYYDDSFANCYIYVNGEPVEVSQQLLYSVSPLGPAGSLYSTGIDMSKWMKFHLNGGRNHANESLMDADVLSATYHNEMAKPFPDSDMFRPQHPITNVLLSYDLGWATSVYRGYKKVWHSGGIVRFSSFLWLFPDVQAGVFISLSGSQGNRNSVPLKLVANRAADLLLGLDPWINKTAACSNSTHWQPDDEEDVTTDELVDTTTPVTYWNITKAMSYYEGTYGHPAFLNMSLVQKGSDLVMFYGRFGQLVLTPIDNFNFRARFVGLLSHITQSDNARPPLHMTFGSLTSSERADYLTFPVDNALPITFFRTDGATQQITCFSLSSASFITVSSIFVISTVFHFMTIFL